MIEVRGVEKKRKEFHLSIDELVLNKGMTLIVGRNGAGKSTFLQLLATAMMPDQGKVTYAGVSGDYLARVRREIGFLPTAIELYPDMKVGSFMSYMGRMKALRHPENASQEILQVLHLTEDSKRIISRLSEGAKQRVALGQAMLGMPYFLFLDEPLNGLDTRERKSLVNWIGSHYTEQRQAIVISHDLNEWERVCDYVLWIDNGRPAFYGSVTQWKYVTEGAVWQGPATDKEKDAFLREDILSINERYIRIIADTPPNRHFKRCPLTLEDAYFLRLRYENYIM
ncbi:ABC transporter ATP-binding protein [Salipaludibacillus sp. LMS25]|uniref:ATP-binding cassette domain-containing protein n=1 Tax=Salipaludibacillus sp. LMS25 TaxID=2924031 RepID=UPI0020D0A600|nr:ABC transporter ATP-binding protein [Salipaludibacillus sp. LMS25]UTR13626.1 ABC transporter ATP-binding protein [Salipaludibacillus sp. LMS25]